MLSAESRSPTRSGEHFSGLEPPDLEIEQRVVVVAGVQALAPGLGNRQEKVPGFAAGDAVADPERLIVAGAVEVLEFVLVVGEVGPLEERMLGRVGHRANGGDGGILKSTGSGVFFLGQEDAWTRQDEAGPQEEDAWTQGGHVGILTQYGDAD